MPSLLSANAGNITYVHVFSVLCIVPIRRTGNTGVLRELVNYRHPSPQRVWKGFWNRSRPPHFTGIRGSGDPEQNSWRLDSVHQGDTSDLFSGKGPPGFNDFQGEAQGEGQGPRPGAWAVGKGPFGPLGALRAPWAPSGPKGPLGPLGLFRSYSEWMAITSGWLLRVGGYYEWMP